MDTPAGEVTTLLHAWSEGDRSVEPRLFEMVMPELHQIAGRLMRRERPEHSLDTTSLVNEVYFRLVRARERNWQNRGHFFAIAARAMRRLLIDHARGRPRAQIIPIDGMEDWLRATGDRLELAIGIDRLLDQIQAQHPDWCSIVDLKFFMGLTDEETADALGVPLRTVQRKFGDARRWLFEKLETPDAGR